MKPIYTAFWTRNTLYEKEVARLIKSLDAFGLEHDIRGIDDFGSWAKNSSYTATHILNMMDEYRDRSIVQLNADVKIWKYPDLFDDMNADIGVYYRENVQLCNGTLYLAPSARPIIKRYWTMVKEQHAACSDEQYNLQVAIEELGPSLGMTVQRLPASYCWIYQINSAGCDPVIEQLQCSRESSGSKYLSLRRERLQQIGE